MLLWLDWFETCFGIFCIQEVEKLQYLEETTLSSDLAQGFALKSLTGNQCFPLVLVYR